MDLAANEKAVHSDFFNGKEFFIYIQLSIPDLCTWQTLQIGNYQSGQHLLVHDVTSPLGVKVLLVPQQEVSLLLPKHSLYPWPPFLQTVFYNVVWSLSRGRSYIKQPRLLAICDADSSAGALWMCFVWGSFRMAGFMLFPSDRDVNHLTVSALAECSSQYSGLHF